MTDWQRQGPTASRLYGHQRRNTALVCLAKGIYTWENIAVICTWKNAAVARQTVKRRLNEICGESVPFVYGKAQLSPEWQAKVAEKTTDDYLRFIFSNLSALPDSEEDVHCG